VATLKIETSAAEWCIIIETPIKSMNSKSILFASCFAAAALIAPVTSAAPHGGGMGGGHPMMGGGHPMMGGGRNFGGNFHHFGHFDHFHHNNDFIFIGDFGFPWWWGWGWDPWWGWGYPYGYGYPYYGYGYGGYGYGGYGYGYPYGGYNGSYYGGTGYGNGYPTHSRVVQLQRRLARAGYYSGAIDGIMGPATRRAIRAYERDHGYTG
jgi:hypothetical protein